MLTNKWIFQQLMKEEFTILQKFLLEFSRNSDRKKVADFSYYVLAWTMCTLFNIDKLIIWFCLWHDLNWDLRQNSIKKLGFDLLWWFSSWALLLKTDRPCFKKYRLYTELWHASETDLRGYGGLSSNLRYTITSCSV